MSDFRDPIDVLMFPPGEGIPLREVTGVVRAGKPVLVYLAECSAFIPESLVIQEAEYTIGLGAYSTEELAVEACQNHFIESVDIRAGENKDDPEYDAREEVETEHKYSVRALAIDAPMPA